MRVTMIAAAAALGFLGMQAAHADAVQRYEGGAMIQHMSSPQKAQPYAQGEGPRGGESMYNRQQAAAEQTGTDNGAFHQAAAEQTGVNNGAYHQAAAEQTGTDNGAFRQAAAEQTGVDNSHV